jgi:hypothetical protein
VIAAALGFSAAYVVGSASQLGSQQRPVEIEVLGELDLARYCRERYGPNMSVTLVAENSFGWRCAGRRNGLWGTDAIDLGEACRTQYGPRARPRDDPDTPYGWVCVRMA